MKHLKKITKTAMRNLLAAALILSLAFPGIPAYAQESGETGENLATDGFVMDGDTLIRYEGDAVDITIPGTVRCIGPDAFYENGNIRTVAMPDGIEEIGRYAFAGCKTLEKVTLPDTLKHIGSYAFMGCERLDTVFLPDSIESVGVGIFSWHNKTSGVIYSYNSDKAGLLEGLADYKFDPDLLEVKDGAVTGYVGHETWVEIPDYVTSITPDAFRGNTEIFAVILPEGITEIPDHAFEGCTSLDYIKIPSTLKRIGAYAFKGCVDLGHPTGMDNVEYIGLSAFANSGVNNIDPELDEIILFDEDTWPATEGMEVKDGVLTGYSGNESEIYIPFEAESMLPGVFKGNAKIKAVHFPPRMAEIPAHAFEGCTSLVNAAFPITIKSIGERAFKNCSSLQIVYFHKDMEHIGTAAFYGCYALYDGYTSQESSLPAALKESILHSLEGEALEAEEEKELKEEQKKKDEEELKKQKSKLEIKGGVLKSAIIEKYDGNIVIPEGVVEIGEDAFKGDEWLRSVSLPKSLKKIGQLAFYKCTNLKSITIPEGVEYIGQWAFKESGIEKAAIKCRKAKIGGYAFCNCRNLKSINMSGIETAGMNMFHGCTSLKTATIPGSLKETSYGMFRDSGLEKVTIKNGCRTIGRSSFSGCRNLKSVSLPKSLRTIGENAFEGTGLTKITLPKKLTRIDGQAFKNTKIVKITIPKGVKDICDCFRGCRKLKQVTVFGKNTSIEGMLGTKSLPKTVRAPKNSKAHKYVKKIMKSRKKNKKKVIFKAI